MSFYAIVTNLGAAKFAELIASGQQLVLKDFAVGDGNGNVYNPVATQTALRRETYRGVINSLAQDPQNEQQVIFECLIPENTGGWYMRELGVFDEDGDMILIAKYPETYKPSPADGALLKQFTIKMIMQVGSPDNVTLSVEAGSIATIEYVDNKKALLDDPTVVDLSNDDNYLTPHVFANLTATVDKTGVVQLANDLEVQSQTIADKVITPASIPGLRATLDQLKSGVDNRFLTGAVMLQLLATTAQKGLATLATDALAQAMTSTTTVLTPKNIAALKATLAELKAGNANRLVSPDILIQLLASTTQKGLVELATSAETLAQTAADLAVTPAGLASLIATAAEAKAGSNAVKYITPSVLLQVLATTTQKGLVELATDAETTELTADNVVVTPGNLGALLASTTQKGLATLATDALAQAMTSTTTVLTPKNIAALKATLAELKAGNANRLVSPDILIQLLASTTQKGLVELATSAETLAQTAADLAVTPAGLASLIATLAEAQAGTNAVKYITPSVLASIITDNGGGIVESGVVGNTNYIEFENGYKIMRGKFSVSLNSNVVYTTIFYPISFSSPTRVIKTAQASYLAQIGDIVFTNIDNDNTNGTQLTIGAGTTRPGTTTLTIEWTAQGF